MSLPLWLPTTAVPICPGHLQPWRARPGPRTTQSASTPDHGMSPRSSCSGPWAKPTSSATSAARAAWGRQFPPCWPNWPHGGGAQPRTSRSGSGCSMMMQHLLRVHSPNCSVLLSGRPRSRSRGASSWTGTRNASSSTRPVHQQVGGTAHPDRCRRTRPGPVRRPPRRLRRQLRRHAGPP